MPDDVLVLHDALQKIRDVYGTPGHRISPPSREGLGVGLKNCGTALRFLQVHLEKCYPGVPITLTGDPRLMERDGKPTTQTTSALILHGEDIPVEPDESPYITMSRRIKEMYDNNSLPFREGVGVGLEAGLGLERCWSSASYWYEYVAIHGGQLLLEGLTSDSLQGDRIVADLYAQHFGVHTKFVPEGAILQAKPVLQRNGPTAQRSYSAAVSIDFSNCPDLYPAVALTCEKLSIELIATGTDRLRYKESDRLEAVRLHEVRNDHRIAMSLMAADYPVSIEEQACIAKSYPSFVPQHITPIRGVNDDHLGKKHALSKLIHAATSEYVWLHDDDVVWPSILQRSGLTASAVLQCNGLIGEADLVILPLRMEFSLPLWVKSSARSDCRWPSVEQSGVGLLEKLQIAEYAAIQELTMRTAKRGHAVMCSGANLIVRRDVWLACESELHPDIPSGDDMFLLEAAKRHGYTVSVIDEPDYTAIVRPATTWRAFFRQRMRWAGKAPHYTDRDIRRCGLIITLANIAQLLCPPIILIKFPIEYSLIRKRESSSIINHQSSIKEPRTPWYVALLLEILYPFYLLICLIGGLFRREW